LDENNSEIPIKAVMPGMKIQSYNPTDKKMEIQEVKKLLVHKDKPTILTKIVFTNSNLIYANTSNELNLIELEATQNHPILTNNGIKKILDITLVDKLVYFNSTTKKFEECEILSIVRNNRVVNEVYNIQLNSNNLYLVHGVPASSKCPFVFVKTENVLI
jgi:intein/homing endonuclease